MVAVGSRAVRGWMVTLSGGLRRAGLSVLSDLAEREMLCIWRNFCDLDAEVVFA